jgi:acetylornithine deacetylase/succinyl-diaminopimelate desuccinylase-like protein
MILPLPVRAAILRTAFAAALVAGAPATPFCAEAAAERYARIADTVDAVAETAVDRLAAYIRVDTINPPGNEVAGARYLADLLAGAKIAGQVFESEPGRGNLYARLPGGGGRPPIVLLSHIDVVPVDPDKWKYPPMTGIVTSGYVYGRGAIDAKGVAIVHALAVMALRRSGELLSRDVILLATAGEETGGHVGAKWVLENRPEFVAGAGLVLNEGGFIRTEKGLPLLFHVAAAEKGPCWFRISASGRAGHGSRPPRQTAVTRLLAALTGLVDWERPFEVVPVARGYFDALAEVDVEHAEGLRGLPESLEDDDFREWFFEDPAREALISDTLTPTVLSGSSKTNVIPSEASARVDSRLLPGRDCDEFLERVRERVGEDVDVSRDTVSFPASASPIDGELAAAVSRLAASERGNAVVLPAMLTGFTDSHYFREAGIPSYGFIPIEVGPAERAAMHGPNERVGVESIKNGVRRMVRLLLELDR